MRIILVIIYLLTLTACPHNVQTTSGKAYLAQYPTESNYQQASADNSEWRDIDAEVRAAAAVEPQLKFPARFGIAKIVNGDLAPMTQSELDLWGKARDSLGTQFGEFVPISPLIAEMVVGQTAPSTSKNRLHNVIRKIRLGAARQHLDAVLLYEVYGKSSRSSNFLSLMDLTIVGAYITPGQSLDAEGYAKALLLDVRNGYPYGTAEGVATQAGISTRVGSGARQRALYDATILEATERLIDSLQKMFWELKQQLS